MAVNSPVTKPLHVLLLPEDPHGCLFFEEELRRDFTDPHLQHVTGARAFADALAAGGFDLAITGSHTPWSDGIAIVRAIKEREPGCPVVMCTASGNEELAVGAMKAGADDYVVKSGRHPGRLAAAVRDALERPRKGRPFRAAEEAREDSGRRFELALKSSPILVFTQDNELRYTWVYNPQLGYSVGQVLGQTDETLMPPDDASRLTALKRRVLGSGQGLRQEVKITRAGKDAFYDLTIEPLRAPGGDVMGIACAATDVTGHKRVEDDLRAAERRLQFLLSSTPAVIYTAVTYDHATFVSENAAAMLGYEAREFVEDASFWRSRIHPEDAPLVQAEIPNLFERGHHIYEYRFRHKNGTYRWLRDEARVIRSENGRPPEIAGYLIDITDRKTAEEELARRARQLEEAQRVAHIGSWELDLKTDTLTWSDEHYRIFGLEPGNFSGLYDDGLQFVHPDDRQFIRTEVERAVKERGSYNVELRIRRADGSERYISSRGETVVDDSGRPVRMVGTAQDITEHKKSEEALQQSEQRFSTFMHNLPAGAVIKDLQGRYVYANDIVRRLSPGDWRGKTDEDIFPPATAAQLRENDRFVLESGRVLQTVETTPQGDGLRHWLINKFPLLDGNGKAVLLAGVGVDITEQKRVEEELRKSEAQVRRALEERQQLSRDLHDTIIQTIYAAGFGLEECQRLIEDGDGPRAVSNLAAAISTLNGAIRDIRKFITEQEPALLTAPHLQSELASLARNIEAAQLLRFSVEVDPLAASRLAPDEAHHVLCIAREAMSNSLRHSRARHGAVSLRAQEGRVRFEATDDGVGFDVEKFAGHGQGLTNIATRARLIGARLETISAPGRGTRIVVNLPNRAVHEAG